jgi:NAD(P)H-nitrite reductase large subunit
MTHQQSNPNTLCHCLRIDRSQVEDCIAVTGAETVREVAEHSGAGSACMACHCRIRDLLSARTAPDENLAIARV